MRSVREHFISDLAKKMASRFKQGYLLEVVGLRDKEGRDISSAMSDEKCPRSVYHVEMERREVERKRTKATSDFLRKFEERTARNKNSNLLISNGIPYRATA